mgnify:CR=1 FL=1
MAEDPLKTLSDMASDAHAGIQQTYEHLNPVIEVRRGMREAGIPADVMTIDCLRTRRRILLILHDDEPGMLLYQFVTLEDEMGETFERMPLAQVNQQTLVDWIKGYFSPDA